MTKICCLIPARLNSSRFNRKLLKKIKGEHLIEYVRKRTLASFANKDIFVATCDKEIRDIVLKNNGNVIMTKKTHKDGTSRVSEAIKNIDCTHAVIVQGDEPMITKKILNKFKREIKKNPNTNCFNYASRFKGKKVLFDSNSVKCIIDNKYFISDAFRIKKTLPNKEILKLQGVFAYKKNFLLKIKFIKENNRQKKEKIEQLRIILSKYKIKSIIGNEDYQSINTPEDYRKIKRILN
jgi:3-deoxy-manno-octulosonate cytidylyltransferase (CMP-KDO synthetase)